MNLPLCLLVEVMQLGLKVSCCCKLVFSMEKKQRMICQSMWRHSITLLSCFNGQCTNFCASHMLFSMILGWNLDLKNLHTVLLYSFEHFIIILLLPLYLKKFFFYLRLSTSSFVNIFFFFFFFFLLGKNFWLKW